MLEEGDCVLYITPGHVIETLLAWFMTKCMKWKQNTNVQRGHFFSIWPSLSHIDGLVQERRNSSALAMELRLSCINPSIFWLGFWHKSWVSVKQLCLNIRLLICTKRWDKLWSIAEFYDISASSSPIIWCKKTTKMDHVSISQYNSLLSL